jgi:hypothetical protein
MQKRAPDILVGSFGLFGALSGAAVGHAIAASRPYGEPWRLEIDAYTSVAPVALAVGSALCLSVAAVVSELRRAAGHPRGTLLLTVPVAGAVGAAIWGAVTEGPLGALAAALVGAMYTLVLAPALALCALSARRVESARPGSVIARAHRRSAYRVAFALAAPATLLSLPKGIPAIPPLLAFPLHGALACAAALVALSAADVLSLRRLRALEPKARGLEPSSPEDEVARGAVDFGRGDERWGSLQGGGPGYRDAPKRRVVARGDHAAARRALLWTAALGGVALASATVAVALQLDAHLGACERAFAPTSIVLSSTTRTYLRVCP